MKVKIMQREENKMWKT